jgi:hypothetical protein
VVDGSYHLYRCGIPLPLAGGNILPVGKKKILPRPPSQEIEVGAHHDENWKQKANQEVGAPIIGPCQSQPIKKVAQ